MEDLGTYSAFFEQFRMSIQLVTDYVLEKLSTAAGIFEEAAVQDPVEFLENEFGLFQINRTGVRLLFRSVWMLDGETHSVSADPRCRWLERDRADLSVGEKSKELSEPGRCDLEELKIPRVDSRCGLFSPIPVKGFLASLKTTPQSRHGSRRRCQENSVTSRLPGRRRPRIWFQKRIFLSGKPLKADVLTSVSYSMPTVYYLSPARAEPRLPTYPR